MICTPIRVLLVEDSPVALTILKRILATSSDLEVVGTAGNGLEALQLIATTQPQVVCTDLHMPKMNGLELTHRIMAECPRPILVISSSVHAQEDAHNVFQLLQAGALDVFPKPNLALPAEYERVKQALIHRIKVLAGVKVFTRHPFSSASVATVAENSGEPLLQTASSGRDPHRLKVVAIGASTGGPQALYTILKQLPANFPIPILCVQHISEGFLVGLVEWLGAECSLPVMIARFGEIPQPGTVYFAPERQHLQINAQGQLMTVAAAPVSGHCPSATVLFQSVAACYQRATVGILLTGMGRDGAEGLQAIARAGGSTIVQDEATSIVFGMPKAAIALGAAQHILPIHTIAPLLLGKLWRRSLPG